MSKDQLFVRIITALMGLIVLWGLAVVFLTVTQDPSDATTWRLIGAFATMFSGLLGVVAGYIMGRNGDGRR